jgi:hypothetical protein
MKRKFNCKNTNTTGIVFYYYVTFQRVYSFFQRILNKSIPYYEYNSFLKFEVVTIDVHHLSV